VAVPQTNDEVRALDPIEPYVEMATVTVTLPAKPRDVLAGFHTRQRLGEVERSGNFIWHAERVARERKENNKFPAGTPIEAKTRGLLAGSPN
jgi:hypothetical protein